MDYFYASTCEVDSGRYQTIPKVEGSALSTVEVNTARRMIAVENPLNVSRLTMEDVKEDV